MDGLSAAASSIAVASISIQLVGSVKKLCDFWDSVRDAPEDVRAISSDMKLLSTVLSRVAHEAQQNAPDEVLGSALDGCWDKVRVLTRIISEIEPAFDSKCSRVRRWATLKAALRQEKLRRYQDALERLKSTLSLIQQLQIRCTSRRSFITLEQSFLNVLEGVSSSTMQQRSHVASKILNISSHNDAHPTISAPQPRRSQDYKPQRLRHYDDGLSSANGSYQKQSCTKSIVREERSILGYLVFTVRAETKESSIVPNGPSGLGWDCSPETHEYETTYTVYPTAWLIGLGVRLGLRLTNLSSSIRGWKNTLETFRPVPDSALIFRLCKSGNVPAIRELLAKGKASVKDTDSFGYTPLHFAARSHHLELCKFLKGAGSDIHATTHIYGWTAMNLASLHSGGISQSSVTEIYETIHTLMDPVEFSDGNGHGWLALWQICAVVNESHTNRKAKAALLLQMFKLLSFELRTCIDRYWLLLMLQCLREQEPEAIEAANYLLNTCGPVSISESYFGPGGYTLLYDELIERAEERRLSVILSRGPDLYEHSLRSWMNPRGETPMSLAMYSARTFSTWLNALVNNAVDPEEYVAQEWKKNEVVHPGWRKQTLLKLVLRDHEPDLDLLWRRPPCSDCSVDRYDVHVQPYWRHLLEKIKQEIDTETIPPAHPDGAERADEILHDRTKAAVMSRQMCRNPHAAKHATLMDHNEPGDDFESRYRTDSKQQVIIDSHGYPENVLIQSESVYARHELLCKDCWRHYIRTGTRRPPRSDEEPSLDEDNCSGVELAEVESSDDEYSPYLIHF